MIIREWIHIDTIMRVLCSLWYTILTVYSSSFSIVDESNRVPSRKNVCLFVWYLWSNAEQKIISLKFLIQNALLSVRGQRIWKKWNSRFETTLTVDQASLHHRHRQLWQDSPSPTPWSSPSPSPPSLKNIFIIEKRH